MGLKITMNKWQCKTGEAVARKLAAAAALKQIRIIVIKSLVIRSSFVVRYFVIVTLLYS